MAAEKRFYVLVELDPIVSFEGAQVLAARWKKDGNYQISAKVVCEDGFGRLIEAEGEVVVPGTSDGLIKRLEEGRAKQKRERGER